MFISIRQAENTDLSTLQTILNDAIKYKLSKDDEAWGSESWTEAEVSEVIKLGNTKLVYLDNEVAGCVDLIWEDVYNWGDKLGSDGLAAYIHRLAVLEDFKGRGIGAEIIKWVSSQAVSNGRPYLRLDCRASNTSLCKYYENQGFKLVNCKELPSASTAHYQKSVQ